jgi:DNA-directed RNA polymerase subunit M/transcription elongation factor TFIIS
MGERLKIICPKCGNVIAVAPEAGLIDSDLICSNCGAALQAPGPLEKAADKVESVLKEAQRKIERKVRSD